jgi:hypothetical protein
LLTLTREQLKRRQDTPQLQLDKFNDFSSILMLKVVFSSRDGLLGERVRCETQSAFTLARDIFEYFEKVPKEVNVDQMSKLRHSLECRMQ